MTTVAKYGGVLLSSIAKILGVVVPGGAAINSIQTGSIAITSTNTSNTAAITSVDTSKSLLLFNGMDWSREAESDLRGYIDLQNATTVRARRHAPWSSTQTFNFTVIEFASGIASVQRGVTLFTTSQATTDVTISSVNTSNAFCIFLGSSVNSSNPAEIYVRINILNATTLRATRDNAAAGTPNFSWEVIEFE